MTSPLDPPAAEDLTSMLNNVEITGPELDPGVLPPPGSKVKVVRSVRLLFDVSQQLDALAATRGVTTSALMAELIELGLRQPSAGQLVAVSDVIQAITEAVHAVPSKTSAA